MALECFNITGVGFIHVIREKMNVKMLTWTLSSYMTPFKSLLLNGNFIFQNDNDSKNARKKSKSIFKKK